MTGPKAGGVSVWKILMAVLPDARDIAALAGLAMVFYGTRAFSEPAAWIVAGCGLFGLASVSLFRGGRP